MKYRSEIDGLRAIAVLPVIFSHAGIPGFGGGFIGVDIFFVISGFLITTIIQREIELNNFGIFNFYEKRARRILPPLFLMMFVSIPFAYLWMLPDELKNFGQSLVATAAFSNNILLAITSGYWDLSSEFKPLLHTWSLGVEEQYYVIFPLILLAWNKLFKKINIIYAITILAIASFVYAIFNQNINANANYYLLPSRAWELLAGSLVSFILRYQPELINSRTNKNLLSIVGFLMIVYSIIYFDSQTPYPSAWTLIPTIGASLIILFANEETSVYSVLSKSPLVLIGKISYSAYLWHWPLLSFARVYSSEPPELILRLILVGITFLLAWISYVFIETPFRNKKLFDTRKIAITSILTSATLIGCGMYLWVSYGVLNRIYALNIAKISDIDKNVYNSRVFKYKKNYFEISAKVKILVVGNSFARDFVNMTIETFDENIFEIIYRDDLTFCIDEAQGDAQHRLFNTAQIIVYSSDKVESYAKCLSSNIDFSNKQGVALFYTGPKHFGYNLNWIARLPKNDMQNKFNKIMVEAIQEEDKFASVIPSENAIPFMSKLRSDNHIQVTDRDGLILSADRVHLTKYGAIFAGNRCLLDSAYGRIIFASPYSTSNKIKDTN